MAKKNVGTREGHGGGGGREGDGNRKEQEFRKGRCTPLALLKMKKNGEQKNKKKQEWLTEIDLKKKREEKEERAWSQTRHQPRKAKKGNEWT